MSKVDAQRAMRDARYARFAAAKAAEEAEKSAPKSGRAPATPAAGRTAVDEPLFSPEPAVAPVGKGPADELAATTPRALSEPADQDSEADANTGQARPKTAGKGKAGGASATEEPGPEESPAAPGAAEELCGHRSINGRACARPKGHEQRSHRYG
jgi:hypothetical protein